MNKFNNFFLLWTFIGIVICDYDMKYYRKVKKLVDDVNSRGLTWKASLEYYQKRKILPYPQNTRWNRPVRMNVQRPWFAAPVRSDYINADFEPQSEYDWFNPTVHILDSTTTEHSTTTTTTEPTTTTTTTTPSTTTTTTTEPTTTTTTTTEPTTTTTTTPSTTTTTTTEPTTTTTTTTPSTTTTTTTPSTTTTTTTTTTTEPTTTTTTTTPSTTTTTTTPSTTTTTTTEKPRHRCEDMPYFRQNDFWPRCQDIFSKIIDQGQCLSNWASTVAAVMSDRICIVNQPNDDTTCHNEPKVLISAYDLINCCRNCLGDRRNMCHGGDFRKAWIHIKERGVVTGGFYNQHNKQFCKPYPYAPLQVNMGYGECEESCQPGYSEYPYSLDRHFIEQEVSIPLNEAAIQCEMYYNGSVAMELVVRNEFPYYKSGIYKPTPQYGEFGQTIYGGHGLRLVGWDQDNTTNVKYWVAANTWGDDWGENGHVRIIKDFELTQVIQVTAGKVKRRNNCA